MSRPHPCAPYGGQERGVGARIGVARWAWGPGSERDAGVGARVSRGIGAWVPQLGHGGGGGGGQRRALSGGAQGRR